MNPINFSLDSPMDSRYSRREALRRISIGGGVTLLVAAGAGSLSGCAGLEKALKGYELSLEKLRESMAGFFPLKRKLLDYFDVGLALPKLALQPAANRIGTELDMSLSENRFINRSFSGQFGISSGLRYEPSDNSLRLASVNSDKLALPGVPSLIAPQVEKVGGLLVEKVLEGYKVHAVPDSMVRTLDAIGLMPGTMKVSATGVGFDLVPRKA
jgi:hypothetical protein